MSYAVASIDIVPPFSYPVKLDARTGCISVLRRVVSGPPEGIEALAHDCCPHWQ